MKGYLGVDVGSVSLGVVIIDHNQKIWSSHYLRTQGQPVQALQKAMNRVHEDIKPTFLEIKGVCTTGSARRLSGIILGADIVKNEITAHAVAAINEKPDVQTVLEIGGQDSKLILLRDGVVVDFAMNTVCAAGTGSFLDHQSSRLGIAIEEFGEVALKSQQPARIAGRCSVFAESDMIHKQQMGHNLPDLAAGLCESLVRNYLNNVGKGKEILTPIVFQGGVAANQGIRAAFANILEEDIIVPVHYDVMGALGAALLARAAMRDGQETCFRGFSMSNHSFKPSSFICQKCPNLCNIISIDQDGELLARWGGNCNQGKLG